MKNSQIQRYNCSLLNLTVNLLCSLQNDDEMLAFLLIIGGINECCVSKVLRFGLCWHPHNVKSLDPALDSSTRTLGCI